MATYRTIKESGDFVTVHKSFVFDDNLSAKAKGILLYFLSRPDNWQIYTSEVVKHMNDGQKSINSGIQELIQMGYVIRTRKRKENGDFNGFEYLVYEKPKQIGEMPFGENAKRENAKGLTTNNNSTNNDLTNNNSRVDHFVYKEIIEYLNRYTGKKFNFRAKANQELIKARFNEGYSKEDFLKVIDNKVSEWIDVDSMKDYLQPSTLFRKSNFDKYLNQSVQKTKKEGNILDDLMEG